LSIATLSSILCSSVLKTNLIQATLLHIDDVNNHLLPFLLASISSDQKQVMFLRNRPFFSTIQPMILESREWPLSLANDAHQQSPGRREMFPVAFQPSVVLAGACAKQDFGALKIT
jgi:hypothetical protein